MKQSSPPAKSRVSCRSSCGRRPALRRRNATSPSSDCPRDRASQSPPTHTKPPPIRSKLDNTKLKNRWRQCTYLVAWSRWLCEPVSCLSRRFDPFLKRRPLLLPETKHQTTLVSNCFQTFDMQKASCQDEEGRFRWVLTLAGAARPQPRRSRPPCLRTDQRRRHWPPRSHSPPSAQKIVSSDNQKS